MADVALGMGSTAACGVNVGSGADSWEDASETAVGDSWGVTSVASACVAVGWTVAVGGWLVGCGVGDSLAQLLTNKARTNRLTPNKYRDVNSDFVIIIEIVCHS